MKKQLKQYFYHPLFWVSFSVLSMLSLTLSILWFDKAIPLLNVSVTINKEDALEIAKKISKAFNLGPQNYQQSAYFNSDSHLQNYIELECGGNKVFQELLQKKIYYPYTWHIRHFEEGKINETIIKLTPDGKLYGFYENLDNESQIASLEYEKALQIIQSNLKSLWDIDLSNYKLIEKSNEIQPSGRVDHTFVYERTDYNICQAYFRLLVVLSGNKITTVNHYVKIPESFDRKFKELKTTNQNINSLARTIIYIIYLIGGCIGGLLYLFKNNLLVLRTSFIIGSIIALLQLIYNFNQIQLIWFSYPTSYSITTFLIQHILSLLVLFFIWIAIYCSTLAVAEGLTRIAFGNQIQLFKLFNKQITSSKEVFFIILLVYLLLGFIFGYVVLFYIIGIKAFSWWSPSSMLVNPNILSTYAPGYNVIALALGAAFWEECIFRAIPIATCTILGQKFGYRKTGIILGLFLQAIIFGAAHAYYPTIPGYVRLIELFIPSIVFGLLYVNFGLFPVILLHFIYDTILFALPIFFMQAPGILIQKILIIITLITPLMAIIISRLINKKWSKIPEQAYNKLWQQDLNENKTIEKIEDIINIKSDYQQRTFTKRHIIILTILGICGLIFWLATTKLISNVPQISITKKEAIENALNHLQKKGVFISKDYKIIAQIDYSPKNSLDKLQEKFIRQLGGQNLYNILKNSYLSSPSWHIRFAKFEGSQDENTREYNVYVNGKGKIIRVLQIIPENEPGTNLTEDQARNLAKKTIETEFEIKNEDLVEVSAQLTKKPNRNDWIFEFNDKKINLEKGQARIKIEISGNQVIDYKRYINVPEQYIYNEKRKEPLNNIISIIAMLAFFTLLAFTFTDLLALWHKKIIILKDPIIFTLCFFILSIVSRILNLPEITINFNTSQSYYSQLWNSELMSLVNIVIDSITIFFISTIIFKQQSYLSNSVRKFIISLYLALIIIGGSSFIKLAFSSSEPNTFDYSIASSYLPVISIVALYINLYLKNCFYLLYLSYLGSRSLIHSIISIIIATLLYTQIDSIGSLYNLIGIYLLTAFFIGISYFYIFKNNNQLLPNTISIILIIGLIPQIINNPYYNSIYIAIFALIALIIFSIILQKSLANLKFKEKES